MRNLLLHPLTSYPAEICVIVFLSVDSWSFIVKVIDLFRKSNQEQSNVIQLIERTSFSFLYNLHKCNSLMTEPVMWVQKFYSLNLNTELQSSACVLCCFTYVTTFTTHQNYLLKLSSWGCKAIIVPFCVLDHL